MMPLLRVEILRPSIVVRSAHPGGSDERREAKTAPELPTAARRGKKHPSNDQHAEEIGP
jgi:hypothetical protein